MNEVIEIPLTELSAGRRRARDVLDNSGRCVLTGEAREPLLPRGIASVFIEAVESPDRYRIERQAALIKWRAPIRADQLGTPQ